MLVKRNATLIHQFFVSSLEEVDQLMWLCSKLSPLLQGGQKILNSELRFFCTALYTMTGGISINLAQTLLWAIFKLYDHGP